MEQESCASMYGRQNPGTLSLKESRQADDGVEVGSQMDAKWKTDGKNEIRGENANEFG